MKFAFIADIHLSRYGQDKIEETSNLPERLYSIKEALYEVGEYCVQNKITNIVIGGDIMHGKSIIYTVAQDLIIEYINYFKDITFWVIDGNHDITSKSSSAVSALRFMENMSNVNWIPWNKTLIHEDILFVPYSFEMLDIIKNNSSKILISHFGLTEATLNSGMSIITDIGLKDLTKYQLVLLGHYHKPQEIIKDQFQLYYSGSLIQLDWGEKGEEKRFLIVDSDTLIVDSIPLTKYKKHIEIEITNENKITALKEAEEAKKLGHHVKLIKTDNVDLVEIESEYAVVDKTEFDITNRGISSSMTHQDRLYKFLEIHDIDKKNRDLYMQTALEIIDNSEV